MPSGASAATTAAGLALIALVGRDAFDALFHPEGRSTLARGIMRGLWKLMRPRGRGRFRVLAGPLGLVGVFATWAALLVVGWALVYLPHVPEAFRGATPDGIGGELVDALNLSLVTLTTLGFGDVTPEAGWLRLVVPVEALVGFGLLSASISWLLLIQPALARRRSLAYEITLLRKAEEEASAPLARLDTESVDRIYAELTSRLVAVERDLVNYPVSYYFAERDARFSLAVAMPYLRRLAERGCDSDASPATRLRAVMLRDAVDDFAASAGAGFLGTGDRPTAEILSAYERDHG